MGAVKTAGRGQDEQPPLVTEWMVTSGLALLDCILQLNFNFFKKIIIEKNGKI
jgi:hypothetical protein